MLITLILWLYIGFVCLSYGVLSWKFFTKINLITQKEVPSVFVLVLSGMSVLTTLIGFISIFSKIYLAVHLCLSGLALAAILIDWQLYKQIIVQHFSSFKARGRLYQIVSITFFLCLLLLSVADPTHTDTGQYHIQTIKWIESYPAVPGLGNLFGRFAYNPSFYLIASFFSFSFLGLGKFLLINSFLLTLLGLKIICLWFDEKNYFHRFIYLPLLLGALAVSRGYVSSLSSDLSACFLVYSIFFIFFEKIKDESLQTLDFNWIAILLITCFSATAKLSTAPVGLIIIYMLWLVRSKIHWLSFVKIIAIGVVLVSPWLIRNVILSGYLIYPLGIIDLFDVDWKIPLEVHFQNTIFSTNSLASDKGWIYTYSITERINLHWEDLMAMSIVERYKIWFFNHIFEHTLVIVVMILSPISFVLSALLKPKLYNPHLVISAWIFYIGTLFWFSNAPDLRFGIAFISIIAIIASYFWLHAIPFAYSLLAKSAFCFCVLALLWIGLLSKDYRINRLRYSANISVLPSPYPTASPYQFKIGNITQYVARPEDSDYSCWDSPLPCSDHFKQHLELRGTSLADGFRVNWKKIRELEKQEIK